MHCLVKLTLLVALAACQAACGRDETPPNAKVTKDSNFGILPHAKTLETPHYKIISTASEEQTAQVAAAVESLHKAYADHFGVKRSEKRMELVLYKDQAEFRAHNRSSPWAEAYYRPPRSYAYFASGENPYHWMLHEATHQLLRQGSGFKPAKWANEGIASYFGSSTLVGSELEPGDPDPGAYPIWWLPSLELSGDLAKDIASGAVIPVRQLVTDTGPNINENVNLYYMHYWGLSHFLMHYGEGRYAEKYKELVALGGSLQDFEKLIGPVEHVQSEWYDYMIERVRNAGSKGSRRGP